MEGYIFRLGVSDLVIRYKTELNCYSLKLKLYGKTGWLHEIVRDFEIYDKRQNQYITWVKLYYAWILRYIKLKGNQA